MSAAAPPRPGRVDPEIARELPGLRLLFTTCPARCGPPEAGQRRRLAALSDRGRGHDVVALRGRPVPRAYRTLFRQLGLDPDVRRIPAEAAELRRLAEGGHRPQERIADACRIAVLETGVGVWALDLARTDADGLGLSVAPEGIVVDDPDRVHGPLFDEPWPASAPSPRTRAIALYAVLAPGVPELHAEEALWLAAESLGAPARD